MKQVRSLQVKTPKLFILTALTMMAFAANSLLCRLALIDSQNNPISFTLVRLFAGALVLVFFLFKFRSAESTSPKGLQGLAPVFLFSYALFFSLAYVQISAGTGALILFGSVQLTMIAASLFKKQRMTLWQWSGVALAMLGLIYLLLPGIHMPPLHAAAFMAIAGISWGFYSVIGQKNKNPIYATAKNFVMTTPLVILLAILFPINLTPHGWMFAILSGAITSGFGYVLWYLVLKDLVTSTAAIVQLSVPAITAFGGVIFLGESLHQRLVISSLLIFCGIILKVKAGSRKNI
ncbi:DMT family transporter [Bdellovibrio sp. KM01]|uniref:DMT family transporter n=1 Tax=Bdellovibrio sp. KM01 TaxID=2748865 RepID=UPI0015E940E4|nr:DMT family transporter [Bdellovibrio sp. KM01]QLY25271.1 DMT family transporter [Bdellovibrio sp. KM01]